MLAMSRGRTRGVSLLELMIVLAIAGLVAAAAAPSFRDLLRAQQIRAATGDLHAAIAMTRSQAIARNERVKMMPVDPAGTDWSRGWIVFVDRDGDRLPGGGDEIVATHGPLADGISTRFGFSSPAPPYYIAYNGAGRSCRDTNSGAARWGTLSVFLDGEVRRIRINMLGRIRVCDPERDSACEGPGAP